MPIGDLLASISGGAGKSTAPSRPNPPASIKRKASSDLPNNASKTQRLTPPLSRSAQTSRPVSDKAPSSGHRYTGTASSGGPSGSSSRAAASSASKPRPLPSVASSPAVAAPSRAAPKKGSFAEILARGKAAQVSMGQVGKIQHKKVENPPKRLKDELQEAAPAAGPAARGTKPAAPGYGGTSRPSQRPISSGATNGNRRPGANPSSSKQRPSAVAPGSARRAPAAAPEPAKRLKKAATATTGYAGTARPKPDSDVKKRHHETPRGGALLSAPKARGGGSRGSKYDDEYDEDMDDFIDYDDEEDDGGERGHGYASDGSSDMEAGMDDIYDEEDRAARIARQEDIREKKLEDTLKAQKEERRRRALGYR